MKNQLLEPSSSGIQFTGLFPAQDRLALVLAQLWCHKHFVRSGNVASACASPLVYFPVQRYIEKWVLN